MNVGDLASQAFTPEDVVLGTALMQASALTSFRCCAINYHNDLLL